MINLTIESLARAIHEDSSAAHVTIRGFPPKTLKVDNGQLSDQANWDNCSESLRNIRREQARLMFERIMR